MDSSLDNLVLDNLRADVFAGKHACRDTGERCLTRGRASSEIARPRAALDESEDWFAVHAATMDSALAAHLKTNPGA
ncbi:hypothetical protein [Thiocystis violacea]|uniref:hypothetical protein n=1 Tax=Thiocystis violacea TaxID=13725 RepID=UPI00190498ED|nr:hypothetical protein [Thiocystis violacea]MBK1723608.1 hypothetical protein [Thiocystis violacea]